ncbi:MAG: ATP-binding cassette domain-containing protein [Xenococcaceae cyanobacterium]
MSNGYANSTVGPTNPPIMELQQVSLAASVGSSYLLQDISFAVFPGDRLTIIGPSGAGKTSLLRLLNRLNEPTAGSIHLENQQLSQIPVRQLRQQVVLVLQEPKLLGMTVQEALAYPLLLQQLPNQEIQQRVETWRSRLHIPEDWLERNELQLSLGQRQLVAIARALVMQPKILLLDEPTSALDAGSASHLLEVLTLLVTSGKTTILMVNHQLELAQQFANRVLYLQKGQLLEDTPVTQLDWTKLRDNLVRAKAKAANEW